MLSALIALVAFAGGGASLAHAPRSVAERAEPDLAFLMADNDVHLPAVSEERFVSFRRLVVRFHGNAADPKPPPPQVPLAPSVLPLRAYRIQFYGHRPDAPDLLVLVPKDPAFENKLRFREGLEGVDGVLEDIEHKESEIHLHVRRGEERWTFGVLPDF